LKKSLEGRLDNTERWTACDRLRSAAGSRRARRDPVDRRGRWRQCRGPDGHPTRHSSLFS